MTLGTIRGKSENHQAEGFGDMQNEQAEKLRNATQVFHLLQGKWTLHILWAMRDHSVRLSELKRSLPLASKKALTSSLRSLEAGRIVVRRDLSSTLLRVEYSLSETMATSINALLDHIVVCGSAYEQSLSGAPSDTLTFVAAETD